MVGNKTPKGIAKRQYNRRVPLETKGLDMGDVEVTPDMTTRGVHVGADRSGRTKRVPLGAPRFKLKINEENPNEVYRWMNDADNRLEDAIEGGYRFIERGVSVGVPDVIPGNTDPGARMSKVVGTKADGSPLRAYAMQIDRGLYEADQAEKEAAIAKGEELIRAGNPDGAPQGRYIPDGGIRLR